MTLTIEIDDATLRKVAEAADRKTKSIADWARERLAEAADEQLRTEKPGLAHLKRHFGTIDDPTFAAPARIRGSREIDLFD